LCHASGGGSAGFTRSNCAQAEGCAALKMVNGGSAVMQAKTTPQYLSASTTFEISRLPAGSNAFVQLATVELSGGSQVRVSVSSLGALDVSNGFKPLSPMFGGPSGLMAGRPYRMHVGVSGNGLTVEIDNVEGRLVVSSGSQSPAGALLCLCSLGGTLRSTHEMRLLITTWEMSTAQFVSKVPG
jgi:hypothetical protein